MIGYRNGTAPLPAFRPCEIPSPTVYPGEDVSPVACTTEFIACIGIIYLQFQHHHYRVPGKPFLDEVNLLLSIFVHL